MKKLSLDEVKEIQLSILREVADFCDKNDIKYSLCGGTLLGAVRHKGYIPWDDDIDIMMPRQDYERLLKEFKKEGLELYSYQTHPDFSYPFIKIADTKTKLIEHKLSHRETFGVYIDVFPIDGYPKTRRSIKLSIKKIDYYRKILNLINVRDKERVWYKRLIILLVKKIYSRKHVNSKITEIAKKDGFSAANLAGIRIWGYREREICPQSVFLSYTDLSFEEEFFKGLKDYDTYLSIVYGDYMKLPPKDKQISHHDFEVFLK